MDTRPVFRVLFNHAAEPITATATKFGGQPVWKDAPTWPLSRSTGQPMRFIGQVALGREPGAPEGAMAYLFMTEPWPDSVVWVDGTWDPEGGENAVIVQPGDPPPVDTVAQFTGPTLVRWVESPDRRTREPQPCEFGVSLEPVEEPDAREPTPTEQTVTDFKRLEGTKLGGLPAFVQAPEFPFGEDARLLLQLDSDDVPFIINLGDGGIGYVFISPDGRRGVSYGSLCSLLTHVLVQLACRYLLSATDGVSVGVLRAHIVSIAGACSRMHAGEDLTS